MSKKPKVAKSKTKKEAKPSEEAQSTEESTTGASTESPKTKQKYVIRAIKVTPEILAAAKKYKAEKGVSFYTLGLETISERLHREGFLEEAVEAKG